MKTRWKQILIYASLLFFLFILFETIRLGNTGFEGKTFWDWMELLLIPFFLAGGAFFLNRSERNNEREIATDRQQETALQSYLDRMTELLLEKKLLTAEEDEVRNVARIRTLTVLRGLDGFRKALVVRFLYEAKLIVGENPVVILKGADLQEINLRLANLPGADFSSTYMQGADLQYASLRGAKFFAASLPGASLIGTNLQKADLEHAILIGADLTGVDMRDASILKGALISVRSLKGATMPDGTKHE